MSKPKVLIIEPDHTYTAMYAHELDGIVEVLVADNITDASFLFKAHHDSIALVSVDACINSIRTILFVDSVRGVEFTGPIIVTSDLAECRKRMLDAGCTHQCDKSDLVAVILELVVQAPC